MAFSLSRRIKGNKDDVTQRQHDALADGIDALANTFNKSLDIKDKDITLKGSLTAQAVTATTVSSPSVRGTSVTSAAGFKTMVGPYFINGTTGTSGSMLVANTGFTMVFVATHPGSVVGMSIAGSTATNVTCSGTLVKNTVAQPTFFVSKLFPSGFTTANTTFAKGAMPFVAGDFFQVNWAVSPATTSFFLEVWLTIEMAA